MIPAIVGVMKIEVIAWRGARRHPSEDDLSIDPAWPRSVRGGQPALVIGKTDATEQLLQLIRQLIRRNLVVGGGAIDFRRLDPSIVRFRLNHNSM